MSNTQPRVVVGIDDSPSARRVLAAAEQERRFRSATLEVVGVWHLPTSYGWVMPPGLVDDLKLRTRRAVLEVVHEVLGDPQPSDVSVSIDEGHPAAVLCRAAAGADLLVVGSRGHSAVPGTRLGSVSLHCAGSAPCPLLIVPSTAVPDPTRDTERPRANEFPPAANRPGVPGGATQSVR